MDAFHGFIVQPDTKEVKKMNVEKNHDSQSAEAIKQAALHLRSVAVRALKRIQKKSDKQKGELIEAQAAPALSQIADSLLAHPSSTHKGMAQASIVNIHTQETMQITVDPRLTVFENAREFYRRARKGNRSVTVIEKLINDTIKEADYLTAIIEKIDGVVDNTDIRLENAIERLDAITVDLQDCGILPRQKVVTANKEEEKVPYRHLILDGWHIYIGKNDTQNDELSTRFAKPWDIWMHIAAQPGSHVVIRREKNSEWPPKDILQKVAAFTVWFSKAKHTSYTEVHVTEARFVRKRRHAPPGEVIAERCKTIRTSPMSPQEFFSDYSDA